MSCSSLLHCVVRLLKSTNMWMSIILSPSLMQHMLRIFLLLSENVPSIESQYQWDIIDPGFILHAPLQTIAPGRPKKTRIRSSAEGTGLGPRKRKCKRCGELVHFASKCKNAVDPSFGEDQHWGAENAVEPSRKKNAPKRRKKKEGEDTIAIVPLAEPSTLVSQQRKRKMGKEVVRTTEDGKSRRPIRSKKIRSRGLQVH
ncbi:hypothetical protein PVAP13_9KG524600 [Panicum virgatum]|uniref:CCHC-type domain-containing protein n=1 Tax=Panicum virgatum TaxID=38727 RepID=A0A8T0NZG0_PANVG|nr:hypothetical protein PVAP13_9KG524600 [Panicum virgatum]